MTERFRFQYKTYDNNEWKDVVNLYGDFVPPSWEEGFQYRRKPEVIKPKWPETTMTIREMYSVLSPSAQVSIGGVLALSNASIAHALETGLVVLPESMNKPTQIDYKKDAEDWGVALNTSACEFSDSYPERRSLLFNSCKTSLRAAILKYLELVEKDAQ